MQWQHCLNGAAKQLRQRTSANLIWNKASANNNRFQKYPNSVATQNVYIDTVYLGYNDTLFRGDNKESLQPDYR